MTDLEFLNWFAASGHIWRGWPMWKDESVPMRLISQPAWSVHRQEAHTMRWQFDQYITVHEAACLVRNFLRVELEKAGIWIRLSPDYNTALVTSVTAHIKQQL